VNSPEKSNIYKKSEHRFLKFILPAKAFAAVKTGTKQWLAECPCGQKRDLWDAGGVRYLAAGVGIREFTRCSACGKSTWHTIRKKTETEKQEIP
jgi:hypothetical protein